MLSLYEKLNQSMRWITFESCLYEGLIILHYYLLYYATPLPLYGKIGAAMSAIYLVVYRLCGGLEEVLGSFYAQWSASRHGFRSYLLWQYALLYTGLLVFLLILFFNQGSLFSSSLSLIIVATTFLECTKKSMRSLLKIIFYNRVVAITEIVTMVSYFIIIWGSYYQGNPITVLSVIWPLGFISILGNLVYVTTCFIWYKTLPEKTTPTTSPIQFKRIIQTIAFSYINQASTIFYSSSFLVPLIAWYDNLTTAGIVKLMSTTINSTTKIIDKIFGSSSCAVLAHVKENLEHKQYYFGLISSRFLQVIVAIIIFALINMPSIIARFDRASAIIPLIIIYFLITLIDRMATMYERFFIINENGLTLSVINGISGFFLLYAFNIQMNTTHLLLYSLIIRIFSLCILALLAYRTWRIHPRISMAPTYLVSILSASLAFLFLTRA